jgi:long-chain acyl-CoA synthetase
MSQAPAVKQFDSLVRRAPGAPLVVSPRTIWSVEQVDTLSHALARELKAQNLTSGVGIALAAPNGPGFLAAYIAARRAGCVVALVDWRTPRPERLAIAGTLELEALVVADRVWPRSVADLRIERLGDPARKEVHRFDPGVSTIRLTSGSTGAPRGILVSPEAVLLDDAQLATTMGLASDERILASIPLSHSYGFSSIVLPALVRGSVIVVPEDDGGPFAAVQAAHECGATFFPTVPAYLTALLKQTDAPGLPSTLRLTVSAGAPLRPATAARFREVYGRHVHVFYGASECGGITYDRAGDAGERGTIGTPVDHVSVELQSGNGMSDDCGTVVVRSPAVATSYFPTEEDDRLSKGRFLTKDIARFEGEELRLIGRADDIINVRGHKVNPTEVEIVVSAMAGVEDVIVLAVDVPDESTQLVRAVVAASSGSPTRDEILARCRSRLAPHKVPRSVVLVDRIPRDARGKIDREALKRNE